MPALKLAEYLSVMKIVVIGQEYFSSVIPRLERLGEVVLKDQNCLEIDEDAEVVITRSYTRVDKNFLDKAPKLKIVATATTGTDHIDADECRKRNIRILDAAGVNAEAAAEYTAGLIMTLAKNICAAHNSTSRGDWKRAEFRSTALKGKILGIVGFGRIGRKVGGIGKAFGMQIAACDPYVSDNNIRENGALPLPLGQLLEKADFVSIHCSLSAETQLMIDANALKRMKRTAYLINVSRGEVVDETALLIALREGRIAGAALDVFASEPRISRELLDYAQNNNNLILTPHVAGHTHEALEQGAETVCKKLEEVL